MTDEQHAGRCRMAEDVKAVAWRMKTPHGWVVSKLQHNSADEPLYPQQAIDALRAEVERLRHKADQYDSIVARVKPADGGKYRADTIESIEALIERAQRAEAQAADAVESLEKLRRAVIYADEWAQVTKDDAGEYICIAPVAWLSVKRAALSRAAKDTQAGGGVA